tara:strand:- start:419 stop:1510 length:1092 start_codon:yes stop_codon:yes gene_type:complete
MSFCPYPFVSFSLQYGQNVRPCCFYKPSDDEILAKDFVKNPTHHLEDGGFSGIREKMLKGEKVPGCSTCYQAEETIGFSKRTSGLKKWPDIERVNQFDKLRHIEIMIDNLCNFECRMCNSHLSSKLLKRDKFLGKDVKKYDPADISFLRLMDLSELTRLQIQGGETFISPNLATLLDIVDEQIDASEIILYLTTNASVLPDDAMVERLKKYKHIDMSVSIDSSHKVNDYIRFRSNIDDVYSNIKEFDKWPNTKVNITTNVSLYNADTMPDTEKKFTDMGYEHFWNWTTHATSVCDYAPIEYQDWVCDKVKGSKYESAYRDFWKERTYDEDKWNEFIDETKKLDQFYNVTLGDYHPELAKFLNI